MYASLSLCFREVVNILANVCAMIKLLTHPNAPCTTTPPYDWLTDDVVDPSGQTPIKSKGVDQGAIYVLKAKLLFFLFPLLGSHPICKNLIISSSIDFTGTRRQSAAAAAPCFALGFALGFSLRNNDNVSTGGCKNCRWIFIASGEFSLTFSLFSFIFGRI